VLLSPVLKSGAWTIHLDVQLLAILQMRVTGALVAHVTAANLSRSGLFVLWAIHSELKPEVGDSLMVNLHAYVNVEPFRSGETMVLRLSRMQTHLVRAKILLEQLRLAGQPSDIMMKKVQYSVVASQLYTGLTFAQLTEAVKTVDKTARLQLG